MTKPVAVDIVIDNYNYGRFLEAAIDSALAQRHPQSRVIVVDDGSTDHSREVMVSYGDRITAVFKENGGQASAFNAGWAHCSGDVVIFLDADDVLLPDAAARAAAAFAAAPGAVKVQYRMAVIDEAGQPTGELRPPAHIGLPTGDLRLSELTFPFDMVWMPTSGNAFSTLALERILPIPEREFANSADWYLKHLIPLLGDVVSLQDVCAYYRVHGSNNYELPGATLEMPHVRQNVRYAAATRRHLRRMSSELGLALPPGPFLSVADLANRITSRKLEPDAHPLPGDRVGKLALGGAIAAVRRFDVRWPMKLMFIAWFAAMALAPRRAAAALAVIFFFPERRRRFNPLLGKLKKPAEGGREVGGS
jgi:glycosyltransferase involved in cell wall biosynthesis